MPRKPNKATRKELFNQFWTPFHKIMLDFGAQYDCQDGRERNQKLHVYTFKDTVGGTLELNTEEPSSEYGIFVYGRFTSDWTPQQKAEAQSYTGCGVSGKWNKSIAYNEGEITELLRSYLYTLSFLVEPQPVGDV